MASHGSSKHQKRIAAPTVAPIKRKTEVWVKNVSPGAHPKKQSVPISTLLVEMMNVAENQRQAKKLLNQGKVLVDGRKVNDSGFPVGLMDVISIPILKQHALLVIRDGTLRAVEITEKQASQKLCRIMDKHVLPGGKVQLRLHDGRTLIIVKEEDRFKTGDTIKLSIPEQSLGGFLKMEKGATCYIYQGKHSGQIAKLEEMVEREGSRRTEASLKEGDHSIITLKDYLFVVEPAFAVK